MTTPPPATRDELTLFTQSLDYLYSRVPFSVTSWYRSRLRNDYVGGNPRSLHLVGLAADLVPDDPRHIGQLRHHALLAGLRTRTYETHLHVQLERRTPEQR